MVSNSGLHQKAAHTTAINLFLVLRNCKLMLRLGTYGKWLTALVIVVLLAQIGLPFLFRSSRMHAYLLRHLERSFGRPVQAQNFSMQLLPLPRVDVDGVSIEENPSFGHEYFLRADRLTASVRWLGLLRGHFDFGTISLSRPSLILVRNEEGRWNLEGWLPPAAQRSAATGVAYGPQPPAQAANHLQKIEFDEGRINFKTGDEKRPFAFTEVSGSVEQMAPGRWQLRLEAVPWRSGVALQSTGTLQVRGEVAGTSSRLQPAEIQMHWGKVSIADLFRMITGNDSGVRGELALDGNASVGKPGSGEAANPGTWKFVLHARAARIHRWDLTERSDNPSVSLNLKGVWDVLAGEARADTMTLDLPQSRFEGTASLKTAGMSQWNLRVDNAGIQAQDLMAWYRAFQPDVAEGVSAAQFFKVRFALRGRPLTWEDAEISSNGGEFRLPGFAKPVHIAPVQGTARNDVFELRPVQFSLDSTSNEGSPKSGKPTRSGTGQFELRFHDDFAAGKGSFHFSGRMDDAADFFKAAKAFGKTWNRGWELTGQTSGSVARDWDHGVANGRWSSSLAFSKVRLQVAGLNLPLKVEDARLEWKNERRSANLARVEAFGAAWSGSINDVPAADDSADNQWKFQLHADHLDAGDLDLWFGPRARPNWLQRLLPSLLGKSDSGAKPSELLRRISAEGDLTADSLTIEKVKLAHPHAHVTFHDLCLEVKDADAEWAGGTVRGDLKATFSLPPKYEISTEFDRANLSDLPWSPRWDEHWSGTASGKLHLTTAGVGRDALLEQLAGGGELRLEALELRGWDIPASLDVGLVRNGSSHWASGTGEFTIKERALRFDAINMESPHAKTQVSGSFSFSQDLNITFASTTSEKRLTKVAVSPANTFQLTGPLEAPIAKVAAAPMAQARKQE